MKKRTIQLISLFTILICTAMTCDDKEDYDYVYTTLKDINLYHINNEGEEPVMAGLLEVKKEAYILCVQLVCEEVNILATVTQYYTLTEGISAIKIYTIHDLNKDYPAGSDVSECFAEYPLRLPGSIKDRTLNGEIIKYFLNEKENLYKALITVPDPGNHQFRVTVTLTNDEVIEKISKEVTLY